MKVLRSVLRKCNTHLLLINVIDVFLTKVHLGLEIISPKHTLRDHTKVKLVDSVFKQQKLLGKFSLHKGFISRNGIVAQNVYHNKIGMDVKNVPCMKKVIKALWSYSNKMWIQRCQNIHKKIKKDPCSLTHNELIFFI